MKLCPLTVLARESQSGHIANVGTFVIAAEPRVGPYASLKVPPPAQASDLDCACHDPARSRNSQKDPDHRILQEENCDYENRNEDSVKE